MDKKKGATTPMLYIVQPDFNSEPIKMQERFIWRKRDQKNPENNPSAMELEAKPIEPDGTVPAEQSEPKAEDIRFDGADWDSEEEESKKDEQGKQKANEEPVQEENRKEKPKPTRERKKGTTVVNSFLEQMKEKNIKAVDSLAVPVENSQKDEAVKIQKNFKDEEAKKIWQTVNRLSRYPVFLERPLVQATVAGEQMTFKIESKRGSMIRITTGNEQKTININDISQIKII